MTHPQYSSGTGGLHPVETLWREVGLPEYFLGNGGTNTKLYDLYDRIRGAAQESWEPLRRAFEAGFSEYFGPQRPEEVDQFLADMSAAWSRYANTVLSTDTAQAKPEPQSLHGMIAAIYGELDAEDCVWIDREWIKWRGRGTITSSLSSTSRVGGISLDEPTPPVVTMTSSGEK